VGAVIPLLTLLLGYDELWFAMIVGGIGLFAVGAVISRLTAQPWWWGGLRQLALGAAAAAATYATGTLIGTTVP
jgi:VIT1/CCC1 family predicted Fe2+/Mn2+ transporter